MEYGYCHYLTNINLRFIIIYGEILIMSYNNPKRSNHHYTHHHHHHHHHVTYPPYLEQR